MSESEGFICAATIARAHVTNMAINNARSPAEINKGIDMGARNEKLVNHAFISSHARGKAIKTAIPVRRKNSFDNILMIDN